MQNNSYHLVYLPLFEEDLNKTVSYIKDTLNNPEAAYRLVDGIEQAIFERLDFPTAFEKYYSNVRRKNPYYRIYIQNYIIYYVVIGNVMEIRRLLYKSQDVKKYLF